MPLDEYVGFRFSGHESFPVRCAWLPKGVQGILADPSIFTKTDATLRLGVGKNMVAAIRHWCVAAGLLQIADRGRAMEPTVLGHLLFEEAGWDPFFEDVGSVWLIHWMLVRAIDHASTWHLAFTNWNAQQFRRDDLVQRLIDVVASVPSTRATKASLERDVDVFIRSYVPSRGSQGGSIEESIDSPLVELGLIREFDARWYAFQRGAQPSLPDPIFAFAVLDFWERRFPERSALSFESIYRGSGSPGAAFKLTEASLAERLERLPAWTGVAFDETAGTRVVVRTGPGSTNPSALSALAAYYEASESESSCVNAVGGEERS